MLFEGKEGAVNLQTRYNILNKKYFGGSLPKIKIEWSGRLTNAVGKAFVRYVTQGRQQKVSLFLLKYSETLPVENVEIDMKSLKITLSKKFDLSKDDIDAVMLHEMLHIKLYTEKKLNGHHGSAEFDGGITRLRNESGLEIPFKESSFKRSPKIAAKEGYVMLLKQSDGKYGIATFGVPWMKKNWMEFAETMTRIMNGAGGRIQHMVYFKIKHRAIVDYPAKRSLRRISWSMIDDELAEEIKKQGKYWGESHLGGGRFSPHLVGLVPAGAFKEILAKYGLKGDEIELDKRGKPI